MGLEPAQFFRGFGGFVPVRFIAELGEHHGAEDVAGRDWQISASGCRPKCAFTCASRNLTCSLKDLDSPAVRRSPARRGDGGGPADRVGARRWARIR